LGVVQLKALSSFTRHDPKGLKIIIAYIKFKFSNDATINAKIKFPDDVILNTQ